MAHSLLYQVGESVHLIEAEVKRLLDVVDALKQAGNDELAATILAQTHKVLEAVIALRIAAAG